MKVRDLYNIKVTRVALIAYAGDECHWYSSEGYAAIFKTDPASVYSHHDWPEVDRNIQMLCKEYGIEVVIHNPLVINIKLTI